MLDKRLGHGVVMSNRDVIMVDGTIDTIIRISTSESSRVNRFGDLGI
jgi:hypothetical protein